MADAPATSLTRAHPLDGRSLAKQRVRLTPAPPAARTSLRARPEGVAALSAALGVTLPRRPKTSARSEDGGRAALWLGPDEWLVVDLDGRDPAADCAGVAELHSAVDVSHRNTAIMVEGPGAEAVLNAGCPQDLSPSAFPAGACSRTVLGKAEIVLWRTGADEFRVECWRSFADYVFGFLEEAAADEAA